MTQQQTNNMKRILIFTIILLSILIFIFSCKTTKHVEKKNTNIDSLTTHVIDSTFTKVIDSTTKGLELHSQIKDDESDGTTVTVVETFDTSKRVVQRSTTVKRIKRKAKTITKDTTQTHVTVVKQETRKGIDSGTTLLKKHEKEIVKHVKRKTPFGLYAAGAVLLFATGCLIIYIYKSKKHIV